MNSESVMHPTILINGRFLTQQVSGVQAFARSVCRELLKEHKIELIVPMNSVLINDEFSEQIVRYGRLSGHLWEQINLPTFIRKRKGNVLVNLCNTAPLRLKNQVVTIHDLAFLKNPEWFHPYFSRFYKFLIPRICQKSKAILTVSETIKLELIEHLYVSPNKVFVLGNKISPTLLDINAIKPQNFNLEKDGYFLMVGSNDPRKNFAFVEALFESQFPDKKLVIAGGFHRNFKTSTSYVKKQGNIIHTGYVSEAELKWLYGNCIGLINPSLYEGFGIPNLEAFSQSVPVICSDIPVFRTICKDAAIYFDPKSMESLKATLTNFIHNKVAYQSKVSMGKGIFEELEKQNRNTIILNALTK